MCESGEHQPADETGTHSVANVFAESQMQTEGSLLMEYRNHRCELTLSLNKKDLLLLVILVIHTMK